MKNELFSPTANAQGVTATHTPGPWSYTDGSFPGVYSSTGEDLFDGIELGADVATANARLSAAAPDLLSALQDAVEDLRMLSRARWSEFEGTDDELFGAALAAIAKATAT